MLTRQLQSLETEIDNLRERVESIELSLDGKSRSNTTSSRRPLLLWKEARYERLETANRSVAFEQKTTAVKLQ